MMGAMARRQIILALAVAGLAAIAGTACKPPAEPPGPPAEIVDASLSFEELRADFDAHRGEPRFLTLLAPS